MKSDLKSKLSASFFVLVLALSTLVVVLPDTTEGQTSGNNVVYVPVVDQTLQKVTTATVTLTNVHSGASLRATYDSGILFVASPPSGFYRVDVTANGYYDHLNAAYFRWDTLSNLTTSIVQLTAFPSKIYSWNITVTPAIAGVTVGFYDAANRQIVASATTSALGFAVVSMFDTTALGTFYLFAKAGGYQTYLASVSVTGNNVTNIPLTAASQVIGLAKSPTGLGQNVVAYMLNQDPSIPWIKRLLKSNAATGSFGFDAYPGTYTLAVKADGLRSNVTTITITGNTILDMTLPAQTPRQELAAIVYDQNYRSFNLTLTTTWAFDEPFPGLQYSDVGSLRMQIDLNNNSDGTVDALEDTNFRTQLQNVFGAKNVTTSWLLSVNATTTSRGVLYLAAPGLANFNLGSTVGAITLATGVAYSYKATYTVIVPSGVTAPPVTSPIYTMAININHDTAFVNYVYTIGLMPDFELVLNTTSDSSTFVGGYQVFTLNPTTGTGSVNVDVTVEKAVKPIAKAGLDSSASVYVKKNATNVVVRYYVRVGSNATFTANSSNDPNGNPLTYIWQFGDGTSATTTNKTIRHIYATANASTLATLTVQDVSGLTDSTTVNITSDNLDPRAHITLKNRTLISGILYLKQGEPLVLNASGSEDDAAAVNDNKGLIDHVQFSWGDGNLSGRIAWTDNEKNATKSYVSAGDYTLWLNVTDVIGHHNNVSMQVHVNDTQAPTVSYLVRNGTWSTPGTTLVEQQVLHFIASATRDNVNNYTLMNYSWSFGDGKWLNATGEYNVTHTYEKLGTYTVSLNVTDLSGNFLKVPKIITVVTKPRPVLRIDNATYQPSEFTEGTSGTIVVNITNVGDVVAKGITVNFYVQNPDGTQKLISGTLKIYNGSSIVTEVQPGGKIQVRFEYSPSASGTYTVTVNATSTDQLTPDELVLSGPNALVVHQAAWKAYALWGGVIGVIILVPLLIYLSRRWSRREKKGPRREKKSEEKEE